MIPLYFHYKGKRVYFYKVVNPAKQVYDLVEVKTRRIIGFEVPSDGGIIHISLTKEWEEEWKGEKESEEENEVR